uniref:Uncharacterized protein n=1 Tax=Fagus sylvatica TaxID=28930 RepID=A0A2N9HRR3_FAGSY
MMGETSGPSAQDIRMASFEEKFNDLLNFLIPTSHPRTIPSPKGNWNTLEGPQSLQMYGNGEENVMNKKEDDHSDIRSLQGQPLYPSNQGDTIEPHSDVDGHSSKGSKESEKEAQSPISKKEEPKEVDHPMIPHKRPGHSLEDCHALKNKVQDLVDHGILRINEGSTPSVIIAWPPEHCKDETVIPSPQSQGPTTCGIQPVHLTMLPTLSEMTSAASRCMTLKRKIQGLGHSEPDVPFMVQARKPSMHTVPMKKARSTLGFRRQWAIKRSDRANHFQGAPEPGSRIAKDEFSRPRHHHHRRGRSTH